MIFLSLLISISHLLNSSTDYVDPKKNIVGKLVEKVEARFDCGVIKVGVVNRFIILEHNKETRDTIKVISICSESYGKDFFKAGGLYSLVINKNLDVLKDCYILDKNPTQKLEVWVLQEIKKIS